MATEGVLSKRPVALAFIAALAFLPYINSFNNPFIWDDLHLILNNPGIQGGLKSVFKAFSPAMWGMMADEEAFQSFYRPTHTILSIIDYEIWGLNPLGYHLSNAILHVISTVLIFFFAEKIGFDGATSFLSSAVFAVHPVHTESVSFISARVDLLSSMFLLSSFLLYFASLGGSGDESGGGGGRKRALFYAASLLSLLFALLSKEMAITMPLLLAAYSLLMEERGGRGGRFKRVLPYFIVVSLYLLFRVFAVSSFMKLHTARTDTVTLLFTASTAVLDYVRLLVIPYPLKAYYTTVWHGSLDMKVVASFVLMASSLGFFIWLISSGRRKASFAFLWTFIALIPVLNIGSLGEFSMAERYLYIPSIGYSIFLASVIASFMRRNAVSFRVFQAFTAVLLIVFAFLTVERNRVWADEVTFYTAMARGAPDSPLPHANLAYALDRHGDTGEGIEEMKRSINYARANPILYNSLGSMYMKEKRFREAVEALNAAVELKPDYVTALNNLGISYAETGDLDRASLVFSRVLEIEPANRAALENMGRLQGMRRGKRTGRR